MKALLRRLAVLAALVPVPCLALEFDELVSWLDSLGPEELQAQVETLEDPDTVDADGASLLHHAVCVAPRRVPRLLELGLDPDLPDTQGRSPLHRLFACGHEPDRDEVQALPAELLAAGASPERTDERGRTPLHSALARLDGGAGPRNLYRDGARRILEHGADPEAADDRGVTPLHLAAGEQEGHLLELILEMGAATDPVDDEGRTPLWIAAGARHNAPAFAFLLDAGADETRVPDDGLSVLERVLETGDWRKLDALLAREADREIPEEQANALLARALWEGAGEATLDRFIATGAKMSALPEQEYGDLAWRLASRGESTLLDRLLAAGFPINKVPPSGLAPLVPADSEATAILLERGADPELTGHAGGTALVPPPDPPAPFRAHARPPEREKARRILEAGYPPDLRDAGGRTALEAAIHNDQLWLVRRLLEAGADPRVHSGEAASVLPLAVGQERLPVIRAVAGALEAPAELHPELITRYLGEGGTDPATLEWLLLRDFATEYRDERGDTPLLIAARERHETLVEMLLDYGADREAVNHSGCGLACYRRGTSRASAATPLPALEQTPAAFYALALAPAVVLYLVLMGLRIHRNRPLLGLTLRLLAALTVAIAASATLFYRCNPCLAEGDHQLYISAVLALLLFLSVLLPGRREPNAHNRNRQ